MSMEPVIYARNCIENFLMIIRSRMTLIILTAGIVTLAFGYLDIALLLLATGVFFGCLEIGDR